MIFTDLLTYRTNTNYILSWCSLSRLWNVIHFFNILSTTKFIYYYIWYQKLYEIFKIIFIFKRNKRFKIIYYYLRKLKENKVLIIMSFFLYFSSSDFDFRVIWKYISIYLLLICYFIIIYSFISIHGVSNCLIMELHKKISIVLYIVQCTINFLYDFYFSFFKVF